MAADPRLILKITLIMLLEKNTIKDVGVGDFCYINYKDKLAMMNSYNYKKTGNDTQSRYANDSHIVDMDVMYVVDENILDCKNLVKIIPVSANSNIIKHYLAKQLTKGKYYILEKSSLKLIDDKEIIKECKEDRWIKNCINQGYENISWESN